MKKTLLITLALLLSISLSGCVNADNKAQLNEEGREKQDIQQETSQQEDKFDEKAAAALAEDFGSKLQLVSLQAPKDILEKSMKENYGGLVSEALLAKWAEDPLNAPGRLTSSPWPDRVEIRTVTKLPENAYEIKGEIIEITSTEMAGSGAAAKRPVTLIIKKIGGSWLIDEVTLGAYEGDSRLTYENTEYGFQFSLPETWKDYKIIAEKWEGLSSEDKESGKAVENGPKISIRHPRWTEENPRQDIPIMIFTHEQWDSLQQGKFHIGAAPVGSKELARNNKYIFALPARYNYAFPEGFEEVEELINSGALKALEGF